MKNLHSRIKETRQTLGLSQASLASSVGVSQPTVANWETGSHIPRKKALEKISTVLDVEENWLLSGVEDAKTGLMEAYLSKPIRHVPVYKWPDKQHPLFSAPPEDYFSFAIENPDCFALSEKNLPQAVYRIRIFSGLNNSPVSRGTYLWQTGAVFGVSEMDATDSSVTLLGKLEAEIRFY